MSIRALVVVFSILSSLYLHNYDIRGEKFFDVGWGLFLFNFLRCCWIPLFLWIISSTGYYFLVRFNSRLAKNLSTLDQYIASFFIGGSILTIGIFLFGLASLLYYPLFLGACAFSILVLPNVLKISHFNHQSFRFERTLETMPQIVLGLAIFMLTGIILLSRTVSPLQITPDTYNHYLPFQIQAVLNHSIRPNEVWYQFFYSKGLSLNLASLLLTGNLGPQIISFCYVLATSAVVYSIVSRVTSFRFIPWIGVCLVLRCFIPYGSFSTHHVQMTGWISGLLWLAIQPKIYEVSIPRRLNIMVALFLVGFTVFFPLAVSITLPFLGILAIIQGLTRKTQGASQTLLYFCITLAAFLVILGVNYLISGMILFDPINFAWAHANKAHLGLKCDRYMLDFWSNRSDASTIQRNLFERFKQLPWSSVLRFDLIKALYPMRFAWNFVFLFIGLILFFLRLRKRFPESGTILWVVISLILASSFAASLVGSATSSIERNFIFMAIPLMILALMVWEVVLETCKDLIGPKPMLRASIIGSIVLSWYLIHPFFSKALVPSLAFALGKKSVGTVFENGDLGANFLGVQDAWRLSLKDNWLEAKLAIGIDTPVLNLMQPFESFPSMMYPGTGVLTEPSRTCFFGRWHEIAYEDPLIAKKVLSELGINFFIVRFAQSDHPNENAIEGLIPYNDLFNPSTMEQYFDVFWEKQGLYVLTWRGHGINPLDKKFLEQWRIVRSSGHYAELYPHLKAEYLRASRDNSTHKL